MRPRYPLATNLALLLFGALPLWIALMLVGSLLAPLDWMRADGFRWTAGESAGAMLFWWLVMAVPVALGGVLHGLFLARLPRAWPRRYARAAAVAATGVVPLALAALSRSPEVAMQPRVLIPAVAAMLVYGLAVRIGDAPAPPTRNGRA